MDLLENNFIQQIFAEDCVDQDITSTACVDKRAAIGDIWLKEDGWVAGLLFLPQIFSAHDPAIRCELFVAEGTRLTKGTLLGHVFGPASSLLNIERIALNLLQHLSGIATLTAHCVEAVAGTKCQILDTRKTVPGMRKLQKYAVRMGGGTNHRLHLADQILIKDNHLALGTDFVDTLRRVRKAFPDRRVQVEVSHIDQLSMAIAEKADAALLDNMSVEEVAACVQINRGRLFLEASGGIRKNNVREYAATGVDAVSIGALTHSAAALDISMKIRGCLIDNL
ncbi:MAG: carboxylating nicotinate-nucleotide diphosphorylase [Chlamydiia bacterium]|nr:carboxylating nicotinate-nucleotide diphosphorylase [Chlamydiia bacterium]